MAFPIDLSTYVPLTLDPQRPSLSDEEREQLRANIALCRDTIVFFTAVADAKGLGGHTGGPFDIVPEVLLAHGFMRGGDGASNGIVPIFFDEAGHRVAIQYLMAVLLGDMDPERLLHYREADARLPGHPERGFTEGVKFSSGRLGHLWPYCNGVAMANPNNAVLVFGSDGAQQEGNDAEAARLAVARSLNVKLIIDDNDVTIAGHPSDYLPGFDVARTLEGHGLPTSTGDGEDLDSLYARMREALVTDGPFAVINKRKMAVGIEGLEGTAKGHDVIKASMAIDYLEARGRTDAVAFLKGVTKPSDPATYRGSSENQAKNRDLFGTIVSDILDRMTPEDRTAKVRVFDCDLEGSCGLHHIRKRHPDVYIPAGIMERGNYSAAAGFGMEPGRQGIYGTFSAFLEMLISEITMARLNQSNVLAHFSHAGVDWMADNTCHFGVNNFFADAGLPDHDDTRLYFPADEHQMRAIVEAIFNDPGQRFVFSTRSGTPEILDAAGGNFYEAGYKFEAGKDEIIRDGAAGWVVSYGESLYRSLDAVERLKEQGIDVGLVNKPTLNMVDDATMDRIGGAPFVLVVESQNVKTGLGSRFGTWLLERGHHPKYANLGAWRDGGGGLWQQMAHQGIDPNSIVKKVRELA
ncbi:MAG: transketolase C-terminal domain-containing protein [Planctomycetota bacterium]|jgi:transketolase